MNDRSKQSPHYITELDPENEKFPGPGVGEFIYAIYILLPFSTVGVFFGIRHDNKYLLVLGVASLIITVAALIAIFITKRKKDS